MGMGFESLAVGHVATPMHNLLQQVRRKRGCWVGGWVGGGLLCGGSGVGWGVVAIGACTQLPPAVGWGGVGWCDRVGRRERRRDDSPVCVPGPISNRPTGRQPTNPNQISQEGQIKQGVFLPTTLLYKHTHTHTHTHTRNHHLSYYWIWLLTNGSTAQPTF
jgi:hypothetical protein